MTKPKKTKTKPARKPVRYTATCRCDYQWRSRDAHPRRCPACGRDLTLPKNLPNIVISANVGQEAEAHDSVILHNTSHDVIRRLYHKLCDHIDELDKALAGDPGVLAERARFVSFRMKGFRDRIKHEIKSEGL